MARVLLGIGTRQSHITSSSNRGRIQWTKLKGSGHCSLVAPPAMLGWVAGAWVVRCGWVSRGRLAAAASVTGALALLVISPPRWPPTPSWAPWPPSARSLPATLTAGALLEAMTAILVRGLGLACNNRYLCSWSV
jgi:hypothetical protein